MQPHGEAGLGALVGLGHPGVLSLQAWRVREGGSIRSWGGWWGCRRGAQGGAAATRHAAGWESPEARQEPRESPEYQQEGVVVCFEKQNLPLRTWLPPRCAHPPNILVPWHVWVTPTCGAPHSGSSQPGPSWLV